MTKNKSKNFEKISEVKNLNLETKEQEQEQETITKQSAETPNAQEQNIAQEKTTQPQKMQEGKIKKGTTKRLLGYVFKNHKIKLFFVLFFIIISAVASVSSAIFTGNIVDYIGSIMRGNGDFSGIVTRVLLMAGVFIVGLIATYLYNLIMVYISQGILKTIRDEMFVKMERLPIKYFDTNKRGDIMNRYTNDTDALEHMLCEGIAQVISSALTIIFVFVCMLTISLYLTCVILFFLAFMLIISKSIGRKARENFVLEKAQFGKFTGFLEEMINAQKVIKVFNHEEKAVNEFKALNEKHCLYLNKGNKYTNIFMPIMANLGHLQYVVISIIGGLLAIYGITNLSILGLGVLTLGNIVTFMGLSRQFTMPLSQVSQQMNNIIMALAGAGRIFEMMDEPAEVDNGYVTLIHAKKDENGNLIETDEKTSLWAWKHPHHDGTTTITELRGDVRFFDVDFGYNEDKIVLHDVSLYAKPGHKIAFVGATGAGKTTITNLINRFYDLADGKIRYDGININKIKKSDLRRSIGMVLQDTNLFTGSVKENIRYGNLDATDEQVFEAAKLANADDFIQRLPNGYDTILESDGANLSQGQRQLLSIARAAISNAPVMILDEATSSIDTHTEKLVQDGMDALMKGRTVFVIAHRLSTVQNSNVIMVLEHGRIIEKGTHDDLIAMKGKYYQLYTGKLELD